MSKGIQIIKENNNLAEWSRQVEECRTSGLSVRSWCEQHQIAVSTFHYRQQRVWKALQKSSQIPVIFSPDAHHPNTISHRCTVFFGFLSVQEYNLLLYLLLLWQFQFVYPLRQSSQYILLSPAFQEVLESLLFRCFFLHRQADLLQDRVRLKMGEQRKADLVLKK